MIKNFETVCRRMETAMEMEKDTEKILEVLINSDDALRLKDIAFTIGWVLGDDPIYQRTTAPLKWLVSLGLVERFEVEGAPIEIEDERYVIDFEDGKPMYIEVDGVRYVRDDRHRTVHNGHFEKYTRIITPKYAMYRAVK